MRFVLAGIVALTLTACDSGDVPSPAERMEGVPPIDIYDPQMVAVHKDGLVAGAEAFYFAAGQREVETAITAMIGDATKSGTMEECGAGPMEFASYQGGLTVHFQNGSLVGWNLSETSDAIQIDADVSIGMPSDELETLAGFSAIEDSTLGEEFVISGEVGGFVENEAVSMVYAGVQCFFR